MVALFLAAQVQTLTVGDGKPFATIEDAVRAAHNGDTIRVYPKSGGYKKVAVYVTLQGLHIVGESRIKLEGDGFVYSGEGRTPRAIFQVNGGADHVTIENFDLSGAHNGSHNGAGVRINAAQDCTIRNCAIHDNDMGIMSNGVPGDATAGANQLIDNCDIFKNGSFADPGYNHNLYLGGTNATVQFCRIHDSLTGHNLKCRAHYCVVQYCSIYGSSNRELDFVEAWDTERSNSNVLLLGNIIRKSPDSTGNRTVIHFGQERGRRDGTIFLINNEITTDFMSPIVLLTSPTSSARLFNNVIDNPGQAHPILVGAEGGADLTTVLGRSNALSANYDVSGTGIDRQTLYTDSHPTERQPGRPRPTLTYRPGNASFLDGKGIRHPVKPAYRATQDKGWVPTSDTFIGAG
ncbi:MAG: right-handed parallel beta-helix repeat-containing protein [Fimbriimonas sp.]|nr:right-handed parallel beta-helix repeat-containing protein [Fimbriimonas sp.]